MIILDKERGQVGITTGQGGRSALSLYQTTKILDWSKFEAFADDNFHVVRIMISVSDRVENIVGKGENDG